MKVYRVAILGCRGRGTAAARAYHAHPRTEIVALCDLIPERMDTLGDLLGVEARFTDLDEMIERTTPDIVAIPTGTEFHYELSMRVLEYGVHIDVEKPVCVDLEQADAVMRKASEKGVRVAVHHQGRVGGHMRAVTKAMEEGRIGELRYIWASGKGYYGGYGLMNIGTHSLNNVIKFGGRCRSVMAQLSTDGHPITPEDVVPSAGGMGTIAGENITAALEFENGVPGTLVQHRFSTVDSAAYGIVLYGSEGQLAWKSRGAWLLPVPHFVPDAEGCVWEPLEPICAETFDPSTSDQADYWFAEEYVRALDEDRDHECSGGAARHVLEIMMGIFESGAYRARVDLPQAGRDHPLLRWRAEAGLAPPASMPRPYGEWLAAEDRRLGR